MVELVLILVALILSGIEVVQSRGSSLTADAVAILSVALLYARLV